MSKDLVLEGLIFHKPGTYRITILGALDKGSWSDWLGEGTMPPAQLLKAQ